jgi:signal peptidase I
VEFAQCHVMINGRVLKEPYATVKDCSSTYPATRVPADELFVMGDNRPNSNDSRMSLGFIPYKKVIGRAFVIIWPPSQVGWLHGL